jgi:hypothetical protein
VRPAVIGASREERAAACTKSRNPPESHAITPPRWSRTQSRKFSIAWSSTKRAKTMREKDSTITKHERLRRAFPIWTFPNDAQLRATVDRERLDRSNVNAGIGRT